MFKKVFNNNLIKPILITQNKIKLKTNQYKIILIKIPNIFLNIKKFYIINFCSIYFFICL